MSRSTVLVFGLVLSLSVAGCRSVSPDPSARATPTILSGRELPWDDERAARVLRQFLELSEARSALRGSARVALEGPDFKLNRPQRILVARPAKLRFEIIGLFDQIAAMLAVDGREFGFYDASTGQVSRGPVRPSLLWDLVKIDLELPEIVGVLLGAPRPSPGLARSSAWLEPDGRLVLVFVWPSEDLADPCGAVSSHSLGDRSCFVSEDILEQGGELFYFDASGRLVEMRSLDPGGRLRFDVSFDDYQVLDDSQVLDSDAAGVEFAKTLTIRSPGAGSSARFVWKRVMLADELSDRFFEIRPRASSNRGG